MGNKSFILLATTLLASACTLGPDYEKPAFDFSFNWPWQDDKAAPVAESGPEVSADWWKQFNDPVLTKLVEEGLAGNDDLAVAAARVSQARAVLSGDVANQFPELNYQGGAVRTSNSEETLVGGVSHGVSKPFNAFSLASVLTYEVDLWGKMRSASESSRARLLSSKANRDAVKIAVAAEIANGYFNLRALDGQVVVTENTVKSRKEAYDYQDKQFRHGAVDELVLRQAESELASAQSTLPQLVQARREQETALAILLGRGPKDIIAGNVERGLEVDNLPSLPVVPKELPSSLLERRPDIMVAEQGIIANNADIGAARADYFPAISLSALIGLGSSATDTLLQSSARNWNAGAGLAGPLVDFGRTSARVDVAKGSKEEAIANYRKSVRVAFKEVADGMSLMKTSADRLTAETVRTNAGGETLRIAGLRYDAGYSTYLDVLDAQRNLFQSQLDRITARRDSLTASVNLYKALGGGWENPADKAKLKETPVKVVAPEKAKEPEAVKPEDNKGKENGSEVKQ